MVNMDIMDIMGIMVIMDINYEEGNKEHLCSCQWTIAIETNIMLKSLLFYSIITLKVCIFLGLLINTT